MHVSMRTGILCRTSGNGNCLYNASLIALAGNESLSDCLRALTCAELYLNAIFYVDHSYFVALEKSSNLIENHHSWILYHSSQVLIHSGSDPLGF